MHHRVKADEVWFDHYASDRKPWSMRRNDRDYRQGDTITFYEWTGVNATGAETGPFEIIAVWGHLSWLPAGHVMMTLRRIEVERGRD